MPKPKSQKKEGKSINLKEDDLSLSDAKNEIKKEGLDIEEPVGFKHVKEPKNKFNSFFQPLEISSHEKCKVNVQL